MHLWRIKEWRVHDTAASMQWSTESDRHARWLGVQGFGLWRILRSDGEFSNFAAFTLLHTYGTARPAWAPHHGAVDQASLRRNGTLVELALRHFVLRLHLGGVGRDLSDEKPMRGSARFYLMTNAELRLL